MKGQHPEQAQRGREGQVRGEKQTNSKASSRCHIISLGIVIVSGHDSFRANNA